MKQNCVFISRWDGGVEIRTPAFYNDKTNRVESLQTVDVEGLEVLEKELVRFEDGTEKEVCPGCHEYVFKYNDECSVCEGEA